MAGFDDDWDELEELDAYEAFLEEEDARALDQCDRFRQAADAVTDAWSTRSDVLAAGDAG